MGIFTRNQKADAGPRATSGAADTLRPGARRKANGAGRDDAAADDLRRRARRRLVGAVAMVLAAVIVLPMVLDSEEKPLPENVAIQIPGQGTPFTPDLSGTPAQSASGVVAAPQPADPADTQTPATGAVPAVVDPRLPASLATVQPPPEPVAPPSVAEPAPAPAKPAATPKPPPPPPPVSRTPAPNAAAAQKEAEAARALALLQGRPAPAPSSSSQAAPSRYAVQVVAVRSREGADSLLAKLRGAGLAGYIETIKTPDGQVHRVRLGPFGSKGQAESAQAKLRGLPGGYNGSLVPL